MHKVNEIPVHNIQHPIEPNESISSETKKVTRIKKAKEAEDLHKREHISRRNSFSLLKPGEKTEKEELASKSGEIWTCTSRKPNKLGGYVYSFTRKKISSYEEYKQELKHYPAVEIARPILSYEKIKLGYSYREENNLVYLELPDREALMVNWKNLQKDDLQLPDLNIASAEGIADDLVFIETYFTHDGLLSLNKEFVHDSLFHILPLLGAKIRLKNGASFGHPYNKQRFKLVQIFIKIYRKCMIAKKLIEENKTDVIDNDLLRKITMVLGFMIDVTTTGDLTITPFTKEFIENVGRQIWNDPSELERAFLHRLFGTTELHKEPFNIVWKKLKDLEEQFDNLRKNPPI
ncbi:MAG: hypothetical protein JSR58_04095 [Verrucomicrobia bacterium]|nr:hypothetical protein [Verrucomicrobiota bacterium]